MCIQGEAPAVAVPSLVDIAVEPGLRVVRSLEELGALADPPMTKDAIAGRIWCGYLCPQTVWTDLFYAVERMIEGDRRERMKKDAAGWNLERISEAVSAVERGGQGRFVDIPLVAASDEVIELIGQAIDVDPRRRVRRLLGRHRFTAEHGLIDL